MENQEELQKEILTWRQGQGRNSSRLKSAGPGSVRDAMMS